jgi:hypothetical protein
LGDTSEDDGYVAGAEVSREMARVVGGGAFAQRGRELRAVVDEFADEREETAGAAWWA